MSDTATLPPTTRRGGLSLPKNPGRALQELLAEENGERREPSPLEVPDSSANAQMRNGADTQMLAQVSEAASTGAIKEVSPPAIAPASEGASKPVRKQVRERVSKEASTPASTDSLAATVREALAEKRNHQGGTKASVDMSPELSLRAKRYLLDHGNPALRVLMIELLDAYLTEEGY